MLYGIDVSSWNNYPLNAISKQGYNKADFVIAKATQGLTYVNPYCDKVVQDCIRDNKLWGFYHYAGGNDPKQEARYFYNKTKGYTHKGVPCLDWEGEQNKAWGNANWVYEFVVEYQKLTGVYPLIYVQASAIWQVKNCASMCGLWVASYQKNLTYSVAPWRAWTIWQYSSNGGKLDENKGNLTKESWLKLANPTTQATPDVKLDLPVVQKITLDDALNRIAEEVIEGKYGNGLMRRDEIYKAVQAKVNKILKG